MIVEIVNQLSPPGLAGMICKRINTTHLGLLLQIPILTISATNTRKDTFEYFLPFPQYD